MNTIREIIRYREMITMLVRKNLRGRYKGSVLGFAWVFINPLLQLEVYTIVFNIIMRSNIENYSLFLFIGLIPWIAFSSSVTDGTVAVIREQALVTKVYFPRQILPIVSTTTNFVNMILCMVVVLVVCSLSVGIDLYLLLFLVPIILTEYLLAMGISFIVSALTVYCRDLQHIMGIVVMAWQFLSPVMYSTDMIPERYLFVFNLNPMTGILGAYRAVLYYKTLPNISSMSSAFIFGIGLLVIGWLIFGKLQRRFAEVL